MLFETIIMLFFTTLCDCQRSYDNYTLFRAIPVNEDQLRFLESLPDMYDAQMWIFPSQVLRNVDFTISPEDKVKFMLEANQSQMYLTTITTDVQKLFNQQTVKSYVRRQMTTFDWNNYYRTDDIYEWLKDLASTYNTVVKLFTIGTTLEKRPIYAVEISHTSNTIPDSRSTVVVEGGIHAREWISTAFVTYLLYKILHAPAEADENFQKIAFAYNWVFVPLLNPDGYEYSHTKDRLWRKNRNNNNGVDINRNFDIAFGTIGISKHETSEIYCGAKAFSERESVAMYNLLEKYNGTVEYYMAFHSFGQYLIIPYAHVKDHLENFDDVKAIGLEMIEAIKRRHGTNYVVGTAYDTVGYQTSGVSGCWAKKAYRIPYVMTFELRDTGVEGFALSPKYIEPTCKETVDGIVVFLNGKKRSVKSLHENNSSNEAHLKNVVLILNFVLFITLCFDYLMAFLFHD
ncbi:zinc carboxypeptidase-like [Plodia interpunctella]|uniref:zinc carboxypeptidase-like n=1 Tax=Plodia interpunctella TaxID=58824 RepID=UPI002368542E|nr:zinc carboxypeptidase-like [Plodia interpunctella]